MPKQIVLKIQVFFLLLLFSICSYSQERISVYKSKADSMIATYFNKSLISKIKCTEVVVDGLDSNLLYFGTYESSKNRRDKLSEVTFSYSYFAQQLNYRFDFFVTVSRDKSMPPDSLIFRDIPRCIAENIKCGFLSKDDALKIAIKDSISYPQNLTIGLNKNYRGQNYFWFVYGMPIAKKLSKRASKMRTSSSFTNRRIVDAITGEIIPNKAYFPN